MTQVGVGQRIRELRRRLKLTQAQLAGDDFTKSFISQVEKGLTNPSLKSLEIIARRLGVSTAYLLGGESSDAPFAGSEEYLTHFDHAHALASKGRYQEAIAQFDQALAKCPATNHAALGFIYMSKVLVMERLGSQEAALENLNVAIEHLKMSHDAYNLARAYNFMGTLLSARGRNHEALNAFQSGWELVRHYHLAEPDLSVRLLANLGITYSQLRQYARAVEVLSEAVKQYQSSQELSNYGKVYQTLGYAYAQLGKSELAIEHVQKAVNLYRTLGQMQLAGAAQVCLAVLLRDTGNHREAKSLLMEILRADYVSEHERARAYGALARIRLAEGDPNEALECIATALRTAVVAQAVPEWAGTVVQCSRAVSVPEEIVTQLEQIAAHWDGDPRELAELHSHLGEYYSVVGDTVQANRHLAKSVSLYRELRFT